MSTPTRDEIGASRPVGNAGAHYTLGVPLTMFGAASDALSTRYGSDGLRYALPGLGGFSLWGAGRSLLMSRSLEADLAGAPL